MKRTLWLDSQAPPPTHAQSDWEKLPVELAAILSQVAVQQPAPLLVLDLHGRVLFANSSYERASGFRQAQLLGRDWSSLLTGENEPEEAGAIFATAIGGQVQNATLELRRADETSVRWSFETSPVRNNSGQVAYVALRGQPYGEDGEAASQLRQAQKMQAIGTLAAGVAHDFNNILYAILGNAELAITDADRESSVAESLEEILVASKRAAELVAHILTFSNQSELERRSLPLGPLVKGVTKFLRSSLPSTIEVKHSISDCGPVLADPSQIHQVLVNLGTNALHAMRDHGGALSITVRQILLDGEACSTRPRLKSGPYAEILVADTGCGMDAITRERAFEPYFSTKERYTGVGLGLAVVYGIVVSHDGWIEIDSAPDKGTTVRMLLPVVRTEAKREQAPEPIERLGALRILFVDDEPAIARMALRVLERLGHKVQAFESATAALAAFAAAPRDFDVLVTDQTMPDMTGVELAREALQLRPDLPIVLSSGFSEGLDEAMVKENGIREFVAKPLVFLDLEKAIGRALARDGDGA